jgi:hypothetical protein
MVTCKLETDRKETNKRARSRPTDRTTQVDSRPFARPPYFSSSLLQFVPPSAPETLPYIAQTYSGGSALSVRYKAELLHLTPPCQHCLHNDAR